MYFSAAVFLGESANLNVFRLLVSIPNGASILRSALLFCLMVSVRSDFRLDSMGKNNVS